MNDDAGALQPLSTQIVGSYARPNWLIGRAPTEMKFRPELHWLPDPSVLREAQEDAARLAVYEQERAGMRVVTDGEAFRHTYDAAFLLRMSGVDASRLAPHPELADELPTRVRTATRPAEAADRRAGPVLVAPPHMLDTATSDIVRWVTGFAVRPVKVTVVGPFTAYTRVADRFYRDLKAGVLAMAAAINEELLALQAAGASIVQVDEPMAHYAFSHARPVMTEAINTALAGLHIPALVHVCYGYPAVITSVQPSATYAQCLRLIADSQATGMSIAYEQPGHQPQLLTACGTKHVALGLIDLGTTAVERPDNIARRISAAMDVVPAHRLHPSVDCGMWHLPRAIAYAKLAALAAATETIREALGGSLAPPGNPPIGQPATLAVHGGQR
jgi:5-methyltetrahydropteroyltriglutamate--homocysteine methyltransferase